MMSAHRKFLLAKKEILSRRELEIDEMRKRHIAEKHEIDQKYHQELLSVHSEIYPIVEECA